MSTLSAAAAAAAAAAIPLDRRTALPAPVLVPVLAPLPVPVLAAAAGGMNVVGVGAGAGADAVVGVAVVDGFAAAGTDADTAGYCEDFDANHTFQDLVVVVVGCSAAHSQRQLRFRSRFRLQCPLLSRMHPCLSPGSS